MTCGLRDISGRTVPRTVCGRLPLKDSLIAATALQHDLVVATRTYRDFVKASIEVVDPFAVE